MSKPAVFGLLLSILQCLPVVAGLGAMLLGILGLREIRRKQRIGRPIAIAAILIGGLTSVLWIITLTVGAFGFARYTGIYGTAERFSRSAAEGNFETARRLAGPEVSDETLALWISQLHVEDVQARVDTLSLEFDESQGAGYEQIWEGPFLVVNRVSYRGDGGIEAAPRLRAQVRVEMINGEPRVTGLDVRQWSGAELPGLQFD